MEDTLSRAKRQNEALKQSLRTLMDNTQTPKANYFDEFKENVHQIQATHYSPLKARTKPQLKAEAFPDLSPTKPHKTSQSKFESMPTEAKSTEAKLTTKSERRSDYKELLLARLERQNSSIENLEAEIRRLRLQNQQLTDANHVLRKKVAVPKQAEAEPNPELLALQSEIAHLNAVSARLSEDKSHLEQQNNQNHQLFAKLKTAVAIYKQRCTDVKQRLEACVEVTAFQKRLIAKVTQETLAGSEDTIDLIAGNHGDDGTTTNLILGNVPSGRKNAYDVFGSVHSAKQKLRSAIWAVIFVKRLQNHVESRNRWRAHVSQLVD